MFIESSMFYTIQPETFIAVRASILPTSALFAHNVLSIFFSVLALFKWNKVWLSNRGKLRLNLDFFSTQSNKPNTKGKGWTRTPLDTHPVEAKHLKMEELKEGDIVIAYDLFFALALGLT